MAAINTRLPPGFLPGEYQEQKESISLITVPTKVFGMYFIGLEQSRCAIPKSVLRTAGSNWPGLDHMPICGPRVGVNLGIALMDCVKERQFPKKIREMAEREVDSEYDKTKSYLLL